MKNTSSPRPLRTIAQANRYALQHGIIFLHRVGGYTPAEAGHAIDQAAKESRRTLAAFGKRLIG